jgi:regulator of replication initiation timing
LEEALAAARGELAQLKAEQAQRLERSGLKETVRALTAENQALSTQRAATRARLEELAEQLRQAQAERDTLAQQRDEARAAVTRLQAVMQSRQRRR